MPSVTIDTNVDINASRDAVWDVLTDFASYKEWNPGMRIEGAPEVGTKLHVHLTGMSFKPKVLAATPGKELRWIGKLGHRRIAAGEHCFVLTPKGNLVYHPNPVYKFPAPASSLDRVPAAPDFLALVRRMRREETGWARATDFSTGRPAVFHFTRMPATGWDFVVVQPAPAPEEGRDDE